MTFRRLYRRMELISEHFKLEANDGALFSYKKAGIKQMFIEAISHELAHMICLVPHSLSSDGISAALSLLDKKKADEQECQACALEILALEALEFPRDLRILVPAAASESIQILTTQETFTRIYKLMNSPMIMRKMYDFIEIVNIAKPPRRR